MLVSKYRMWNEKRPDDTSGLQPQTKTRESLSVLKQPHEERQCCETLARAAAEEITGETRLLPLLPAVMKYSFSLSSHPGQCIPLGSITTDSTPWQISSRYSVKSFLISSYIVAEHNNCPDISFNNYLISVKFSEEIWEILEDALWKSPSATGNFNFCLWKTGFYGLPIIFLRP